jgi:hypothetical protein
MVLGDPIDFSPQGITAKIDGCRRDDVFGIRIALFSMALDNRIDIGCVSAIAIFSVVCCKRIHTVTESITSRNDEYHGDTLAN